VTERTVAEHCTDEYQRRAVEEAAQKARRRVGDDREKLLRALLNRGFGMEYIRNSTIFQQINDKKEGI
jgi:SOS response regulatory protein OraA/RecX